MDTDMTKVLADTKALVASTDRIKDAIEENLRFSHLARKSTMDLKARSVHGVYEKRMYNLYLLIQREMDAVQRNAAHMALDRQASLTKPEKITVDETPEPSTTTVTADDIVNAETMTIINGDGDVVEIDEFVTHGTLRGYSKFKCRCDGCRAAKSEDGRKYRERRRQRTLAARAMKAKNGRHV